MKTVFWLLDVNYEVKEHKSEVWIWGIDDKGQRVLIIDRNFLLYFYLVFKEEQDARRIIENISSGKAGEFPSIFKIEQVKREYFGKPVDAVQVFCKDPHVIAEYAKAMAKIEGVEESLEDSTNFETADSPTVFSLGAWLCVR